MAEEEDPQDARSGVRAEDDGVAVGRFSANDINAPVVIGKDNTVNVGFTEEQASAFMQTILTDFQPRPFDGTCPYKGLAVFEEEDAELFFGREQLVDDLVSRVQGSRTVFITGPSGSGKSSLVRAGLIPALRQGAIKSSHSERWLYEAMIPGGDPITELARVTSALAGSTTAGDEVYAKGLTDPTIFARWCEIALKDNRERRAVLFIDQFEEVFTQISKEEQRAAFLNLVTYAASIESGRVIVLFSMRSDFLSNCATYPQLNRLVGQQFIQIGAMQPNELASAIAQPALRVGLRTDPDLIAQIINDMQGEPGALPLMQFALKDLFDSQQEKGGINALTLKAYLQRGGIHKSLERHADSAFATFDESQQQLARSIFSGLIEIGRGTQVTRRTALFNELIPANTGIEDIEAIVHKLADARLITIYEQEGKDKVTISHEKLIDAWPWLKKLTDENRGAIALKNAIESAANEWNEHARDASFLYTGARLANASEQLDAKKLVLSGAANEFVQFGIEAAHRQDVKNKRLQRWIITGLVGFTAAILVLLVFALIQLKMSRAQRLGSQAQAAFAEENYNSALLYAYQSNQIHKNEAADLILGQIAYKNFAGGSVLSNGYKESWIDGVNSSAWSADGQLASGSGDGMVTLWDPDTGRPAQTLTGHTGWVNSVAWSPDGQLASGSDDGTVIIWNLDTGQPAQVLTGHTAVVRSVAWASDGRLASGSVDSTVIIWNLDTGEPAQTLTGHSGTVYSVAWSSDGQLASGSSDNTVIIWNLDTGEPAQTLTGHSGWINSVAWSSDGRLASGSADDTVILWDLETSRPAQTLTGHADWVNSVAWSPDGRLASGADDNTVILWDLDTSRPAQTLTGHTEAVNCVSWSSDGKLVSGSEDNTMILWDLTVNKRAQNLTGHSEAIFSMAWSLEGRLASGSGDDMVILWDLDTGQPDEILTGHTGWVSSVAWSSDGQLASGSSDNTVIIWNLDTGQPAQTLVRHAEIVNSVTWSSGGQLASGSDDGTVIIWNLDTGEPAQTLTGHTGRVTSVAWAPDGRLASGSDDGTVIIWNPDTGQPAQILKGYTGINSIIHFGDDYIGGIYSVAWSPDGQLATGSGGGGTVIVWDLNTGQPAQKLMGHTGIVFSVAWSADGNLASGSYDGTVILWDLNTGQPAQTFSEHSQGVESVAWSSDGRLASASLDGTILIPRTDLMAHGGLCNSILRNMTIQEWLDFQGVFYAYQPACSNLTDPSEDPNVTWTELPEFYEQVVALERIVIIALVPVYILFGIMLARKVWGRARARRKSTTN